jgi:hypothetical protein
VVLKDTIKKMNESIIAFQKKVMTEMNTIWAETEESKKVRIQEAIEQIHSDTTQIRKVLGDQHVQEVYAIDVVYELVEDMQYQKILGHVPHKRVKSVAEAYVMMLEEVETASDGEEEPKDPRLVTARRIPAKYFWGACLFAAPQVMPTMIDPADFLWVKFGLREFLMRADGSNEEFDGKFVAERRRTVIVLNEILCMLDEDEEILVDLVELFTSWSQRWVRQSVLLPIVFERPATWKEDLSSQLPGQTLSMNGGFLVVEDGLHMIVPDDENEPWILTGIDDFNLELDAEKVSITAVHSNGVFQAEIAYDTDDDFLRVGKFCEAWLGLVEEEGGNEE